MIKVETHCHTVYSKDCLVSLQDLLTVSKKKGLDRVIITDHNTIQGALVASQIDPYRFIIGEEIMTTQGELLCFFVKELVPARLSPLDTIHILREQGAFISVSHPFDVFRNGHWETQDLIKILPYIDAIEVFNSRCMLPKHNTQAKHFAMERQVLGTVGSDSHHTSEVGTAMLKLPDFQDAGSLKLALASSQSHVRLSAPWVHFYSRYAARKKKHTS